MALIIETTATRLGTGWGVELYTRSTTYSNGDTVAWSATDSNGIAIPELSFPINDNTVDQGYCKCIVLMTKEMSQVVLTATQRSVAGNTVDSAPEYTVDFIKMNPAIGPTVSEIYAQLLTSAKTDDQIVSMQLLVEDAAGNPVQGAQVTVRQLPGKNGIVRAYQDKALTTLVPQIYADQLWNQLTGADGKVTFYLTSTSSCNVTFSPILLGQEPPPDPVDVVFFTVGAATEPPFFDAPSTSLNDQGQVVLTSYQRTVDFDVYPTPPLKSDQKIFIAANKSYGSPTIEQKNFINVLSVPVISLDKGNARDTNKIEYYVQDADGKGGNVMVSRVFSFGLVGEKFNQPDPGVDRTLQAPDSIPAMGANDVITTDTLKFDNGFKVVVPKLPSGSKLDGKTGRIRVYLNGYYNQTTRARQRLLNAIPFTASITAAFPALISIADMSGYSASITGQMDYFYCEYEIDGDSGPVYSQYIRIHMNT
jgi:hypothetical protein